MRLKGWRHTVAVLGAIFRKDLRVFLSYRVNAIMRVVEPVMWITPAYFLARSFRVDGVNVGLDAYVGTSDYVSFLILGGALSAFVSAVAWGMGFSLKVDMDAGVLESNWLAPVPVWVQLVGRSLFSLALTTANVLLVSFWVWLLFGFRIAGSVAPALLTLAPLLVALYGFGLGLSGVVLISNDANNVIDIVSNNITKLCGSDFPVQVLPRPLLAIALGLPLTYAYDAFRGSLLGTRTLLPVPTEQVIIFGLMLVTVAGGMAVLSRIEKRCRDVGALARH
ncbi:MAG: hypothetical protein A2Y96_01850 [Firmicutes bacterium RBG_13_65_8]|nr:MAG: hypothetical protein A2Y96_01850 [Firmicutes bacterium RBG_13_65_8]